MPDQVFFTLSGSARVLLTGERTALNFLQMLSGTATLARQYAELTTGSEVRILDTRKTIPGLRLAQKYAVAVGGCNNHRIGLYDAFLIKENHIAACGGIALAVAKAREIAPEKVVEVEVENLDELNEALEAQADVVMLDNFSPSDIENLKHLNFGETKIEVSGNITHETVQHYISSAVNYISSGSLTKHVQASGFIYASADKILGPESIQPGVEAEHHKGCFSDGNCTSGLTDATTSVQHFIHCLDLPMCYAGRD